MFQTHCRTYDVAMWLCLAIATHSDRFGVGKTVEDFSERLWEFEEVMERERERDEVPFCRVPDAAAANL